MARKVGKTVQSLKLAKWSVLWVVEKKTKGGKRKKKIMEYDAGYDLADALRVKSLLEAADRRAVTLRCKNTGFPPPEVLLPHEEYEIVTKRRNGKNKKYRKKTWVDPMMDYNLMGIYWCPYCMKLRKFVQRSGFWYEDKYWVDRKGLYCPMCDIFHQDPHVMKWNPQARVVEFRKKTR